MMNRILRYRSRMSDEDVHRKFAEILSSCIKPALELGWLRVEGEDLARKMGSIQHAARARLVLLEQEAHGTFKVSSASLVVQLQELFRLRAAVAPRVLALRSGVAPERWRFEWRRALSIVLCACLAGLVLAFAALHDVRLVYGAIVCLAGLWLLGPWPLCGFASALADHAALAVSWVQGAVRCLALDVVIHGRERVLVAAGSVESLAKQWVAERQEVIRHEMEIQRSRAEAAARLHTAHMRSLEQNSSLEQEKETFNAADLA